MVLSLMLPNKFDLRCSYQNILIVVKALLTRKNGVTKQLSIDGMIILFDRHDIINCSLKTTKYNFNEIIQHISNYWDGKDCITISSKIIIKSSLVAAMKVKSTILRRKDIK